MKYVQRCITRGVMAWGLAALALAVAAAAGAEEATIAPSDVGAALLEPELPTGTPVREDLDTYGGWTKLKGQATGFFHVEQLGGRYWFVTPEGNAYFMLQLGWAGEKDTPRLKAWGFNSSEPRTGMPYTMEMHLFRAPAKPYPVKAAPNQPPWTTFPDVFDPEWEKNCREEAQKALGPCANDPMMIGYFLDNELNLAGWYEAILQADKDAPCRAAFVKVVREYYEGKPNDFARDWSALGAARVEDLLTLEGSPPHVPGLKAAWESAMAERGFSVVSKAAKAAAPQHLNLGSRFLIGPLPEPGILAALAKYCDVISLNLYNMLPDRLLTQIFTMVPMVTALTGRPTLVSEFSFRGADTNHPNTVGALPSMKTQAERAIGYLSYVAAMASIPSHLGVSWYKYIDDPPNPSWEKYAEDCNFGVVDRNNRPYAVLSEAMRAVNTLIYDLANDPVRSTACPLFWRTELLRWDLEQDAHLFQLMMRGSEPFKNPIAQAALPEPRRYHPRYWIRHQSPNLTVNDERFAGWCEANFVHHENNQTTLGLFNVQAFTWVPRALWLGPRCSDPENSVTVQSNAQFLMRRIDEQGRLLRFTLADGSYVRTDYSRFEFRTDHRVPYLDLCMNPETKQLAITSRGTLDRLSMAEVSGWTATWNGVPLASEAVTDKDGFTVFAVPR